MTDRWLVEYLPRNERRALRVVDAFEDGWKVEDPREPDGLRWIERPARRDRASGEKRDEGAPREPRITYLERPADSIEVREILWPGTLEAEYRKDPVETLVAILRDARISMDKQGLTRQLVGAGVVVDDADWKRLQTRLRSHPNVEADPKKPGSYQWVPAKRAEEPVDPSKTLRTLAKQRTKEAERRDADRQLRRLVAEGQLPPAPLALAALLGVEGAALPDLRRLDPSGLDDDLLDVLMERAAEKEGGDELVASVAFDPGRPARSESARAVLRKLPPERLEAQILGAIEQLVTSAETDLTGGAEKITRRLRLVARASEPPAPPRVLAGLVALADVIGRAESASTDVRDLRVACVEVTAQLAVEHRRLLGALRQVIDRVGSRGVRATTAAAGLVPDGPRLFWLRALASDDSTRITLREPEWWTNLDLPLASSLRNDVDFREVFRSAALKERVRALVKDQLARPRGVSTVVSIDEQLLDLVDDEFLLNRASSLEADSGLGRILALSESMVRREERDVSAATLEEARAEFAQLEGRLRAEIEALTARVENERARTDRALADVRELRGQHHGVLEAQLRQARLEALGSLAELQVELQRSAAAIEAGNETIARVVERTVAIARDAGLRQVGAIGEQRVFDPTVFRLVAGEAERGTLVRVVEPAFVVPVEAGVTVIRYGKAAAGAPPGGGGNGSTAGG